MRALLSCLLLLMAVPARADDQELRQKIVGTWKLVSVVYEDQESKTRTPVLGEHPKGRQIATADGRWLALVTAEGRTVPKTDEERAQALRTMIVLYRPLPGRGRQGRHQGRGSLERSLGRRRADALHPFRRRPAVHREPAHAAPERQQQGRARDRDLGPGEVNGYCRLSLSFGSLTIRT
jgi:hypothetical protein